MSNEIKKVNVLYVDDNIDRILIMHVGYDFVFNNEAVTEGRLDVDTNNKVVKRCCNNIWLQRPEHVI